MRKDDAVRLQHMLDAASKAVTFCEGLNMDEFQKDELRNLAVVRLLEVVGEAAGAVTQESKQALPDFPWRHMVAMRNRLIHGYFDVDPEIVWDTVENDLPPLVSKLRELLDEA